MFLLCSKPYSDSLEWPIRPSKICLSVHPICFDFIFYSSYPKHLPCSLHSVLEKAWCGLAYTSFSLSLESFFSGCYLPIYFVQSIFLKLTSVRITLLKIGAFPSILFLHIAFIIFYHFLTHCVYSPLPLASPPHPTSFK